MWRAWGIILLALSPQDLGSRVTAPDHEFAIRPPAGWVRYTGMAQVVAKWVQPGDQKSPAEIVITHLQSMIPTPLENFKKQSREIIKEKVPGAKILEEKDLTLGGRPAYRMVYSNEGLVQFKTCIHRKHPEVYLGGATTPP